MKPVKLFGWAAVRQMHPRSTQWSSASASRTQRFNHTKGTDLWAESALESESVLSPMARKVCEGVVSPMHVQRW